MDPCHITSRRLSRLFVLAPASSSSIGPPSPYLSMIVGGGRRGRILVEAKLTLSIGGIFVICFAKIAGSQILVKLRETGHTIGQKWD